MRTGTNERNPAHDCHTRAGFGGHVLTPEIGWAQESLTEGKIGRSKEEFVAINNMEESAGS